MELCETGDLTLNNLHSANIVQQIIDGVNRGLQIAPPFPDSSTEPSTISDDQLEHFVQSANAINAHNDLQRLQEQISTLTQQVANMQIPSTSSHTTPSTLTHPTFQTNHQNQYRQPSQNFHSSNQQQQYFHQQSNNLPQQQYFGRGRGRGRFGRGRGRGRRNFQNNTFQNYNQPPPPPSQQQNQSGWRPFNPNNLSPGQNIPQNFDPRRLLPISKATVTPTVLVATQVICAKIQDNTIIPMPPSTTDTVEVHATFICVLPSDGLGQNILTSRIIKLTVITTLNYFLVVVPVL